MRWLDAVASMRKLVVHTGLSMRSKRIMHSEEVIMDRYIYFL